VLGVRVYHIYKKITSLGKGEDVDVVLPDPLLADTHAHIHFDGRDFNIATTAQGRRAARQRAPPHQAPPGQDDRIRVGTAELEFSVFDEPVPTTPPPRPWPS
jgi:hypothetical protein